MDITPIMDIYDMKLPQFFRRTETKESAVGKSLMLNPGQPVWSNRDYKAFAVEGYGKNVVAYQAINRVAEAVASIEWEAWRGDTQVNDSPLLELLANPNPMQSGVEFMTASVAYLMISGNMYDEAVMVGGNPAELYTHRPDRMKIIPSNNGMPRAYVYSVGQKQTMWEVNPNTGESEINHIKLFNPVDDWYGQSPIEAGAFAIDQHNESMAWMQALLQNSARPSGALVSSEGQAMSDENFNRLKAQIEEQYSGASNAGRPMLLEGGLDWKQMGLSPTDMGIIEGKNTAARDVSLAFGVPPQLIGIPGDNTYSNYAEARLSFWEDTVIPMVGLIGSSLSNWLGPQFGDVVIKPNLDKIPAIADKRSKLWEMADASSDLTINERRKLKGFEPIDGGDTIMINAMRTSSLISLQDATNPIDLGGMDEKSLAKIAGYDAKD
jgi:HK97 family phage portal protein